MRGQEEAERGQFRRPILSQGFYAARRCSRTLRRAMIASTLLDCLVPHSQSGASALPNVLPKAVREYSTFGGISEIDTIDYPVRLRFPELPNYHFVADLADLAS
jgi:hypothetical protein